MPERANLLKLKGLPGPTKDQGHPRLITRLPS